MIHSLYVENRVSCTSYGCVSGAIGRYSSGRTRPDESVGRRARCRGESEQLPGRQSPHPARSDPASYPLRTRQTSRRSMHMQESGQSPSPIEATTTPCYVGIDVAKAWLDVAVRPNGTTWRTANAEAELPPLVERVQQLGPQLVVLEATGGYERVVVALLATAGVPSAGVNPRQVRDFAKATGRLAKTDQLDAAGAPHSACARQA